MPRRRKIHYGEGSVYESPPGSGRWFAEVFDGHGKSIRRRANSRDEAEAKRQELVRRRDGGLNVQGAAQTLETFVNVWWERSVKEKGLAPKTLDDYRKTFARYLLPDWGTHRLEEFEQNVTLVLDIQATLRREYGPATAHRAIAKLSMLFNAAVRWSIMRINPVMMVRADLPVYKREEAVPLTPEQTISLLNAVDGHRLCALYHIALTLGLRLGEMLGLQWGDIDWQAQTLTIRRQVQETSGQVAVRNATKTNASLRVLPLPPRLLARLEALWETRGEALFLFPSEEGTLLIPSNFERHWRGGLARSYTKKDGTRGKSVIVGVRQKAGLSANVKFHHLRHTVATRLMEQGTPDEIRDAIMGHGKKGIRGHYAHATLTAMREALEKYEQRLWAHAA
jgi:integrase